MSTNKLDLVMTPDGIKKRVITPDDEMPDLIVYQGREYFVRNECRFEFCGATGPNGELFDGNGARMRDVEWWRCDFCGMRVKDHPLGPGCFCPGCGSKVVD